MERPLGRPARRARRGDRVRPADAAAAVPARAAASAGRASASCSPTRGRRCPFTLLRAELQHQRLARRGARRAGAAGRRAGPAARGAAAALNGLTKLGGARRSCRCSRPTARRAGAGCGPSRRSPRASPSRRSLVCLPIIVRGESLQHDLRPHARLPGRRATRRSRSGACTTCRARSTSGRRSRSLLAVGVAFVPRRRDVVGLAALAGAVVDRAAARRRRTGSTSTWCGSSRSSPSRCFGRFRVPDPA